jgi:hypothetical protein
MRAVDRCWCDFTGSFFEPFNVSHWEYLSVLKVRQDLERKRRIAVTPETSKQETSTAVYDTNKNPQGPSLSDILWDILFFPFSLQTFTNRVGSPSALFPKPDRTSTTTSTSVETPPESPRTAIPGISNKFTVGREYDLRPYGLGLVVDLGW